MVNGVTELLLIFFPALTVLILFFFFFEGVVSRVKYLKLRFHFVVVAAFWESLLGARGLSIMSARAVLSGLSAGHLGPVYSPPCHRSVALGHLRHSTVGGEHSTWSPSPLWVTLCVRDQHGTVREVLCLRWRGQPETISDVGGAGRAVLSSALTGQWESARAPSCPRARGAVGRGAGCAFIVGALFPEHGEKAECEQERSVADTVSLKTVSLRFCSPFKRQFGLELKKKLN